ncbi:Hsp20/alpha crystallin family protein [Candidatus Xianfuyuplasma coldseepsis]|uniref:Hsp20 family protein n=1 Tax=Candidatus Xianfuyuplasma coldseepsis TaxID=2782163 RepID=A0A7L7KP43_9MOLU|nr:Hsp20 family protein [Xianfuyuplasma coldseepsis]QMS84541.1 Hsp20 family protein [Xianfuyuplasma coldseepsis]
MYRITPYRRNNPSTRDVFDLFDDFFNDRKTAYVRDFKIDVKDEKDKYIVEAEVPGLTKKDLNIKYENDRLTISINKEDEKEETEDNYMHKERYSFRSERSIYLEDVDPKKLSAKMDNGILTIELMKLEHKISSYMIDIK